MNDEKQAVCLYGVINYGDLICDKDPPVRSGAARVAYYIDLFDKDGGTTGRVKVDKNHGKAKKGNRQDEENSAETTSAINITEASEPTEVTSSKQFKDKAAPAYFIGLILIITILSM